MDEESTSAVWELPAELRSEYADFMLAPVTGSIAERAASAQILVRLDAIRLLSGEVVVSAVSLIEGPA